MGSRIFPLFLKLIAVTVPLTWIWMQWGREAYYHFLVRTTRPVLIAMGVTGVRRDLVHDRFLNYLPFIVLIMITPGLSARRRWVGAIAGCAVIFASHIGLTWASFLAFIKYGESAGSTAQVFPAWILSDSLPFVLWAIICHDFVSRAVTRIAQPESAAPSKPE